MYLLATKYCIFVFLYFIIVIDIGTRARQSRESAEGRADSERLDTKVAGEKRSAGITTPGVMQTTGEQASIFIITIIT